MKVVCALCNNWHTKSIRSANKGVHNSAVINTAGMLIAPVQDTDKAGTNRLTDIREFEGM